MELTVTGQDGAAGTYGGVLTARSADGTITTRTVLTVRQEAEMYDLTVNLVDRAGTSPPSGELPSVSIFDLDHSDFFFWGTPGTVRLPAGRYAVHATIQTPRAGQEPTYSFISHPELKVDRDRVQTLDARDGKRVSVNPDNPEARGGGYAITTHTKVSDCACPSTVLSLLDPRFQEAYAATVPGTSSPSFAFGQARRATEPELELFTGGRNRFEVAVGWLSGAPASAQRATLPAVYGGGGTPAELARIDAEGKLVLIEVPGDTTDEEVLERTAAIKEAGGMLAMLNAPADASGLVRAAGQAPDDPAAALPTLLGYGQTAQRFTDMVKAGDTTASYVSRPWTESRYELTYGVQRQITAAQVHRPRTQDLAAVRTTYHDNGADSMRHFGAATPFFGTSLSAGWTLPVRVPTERTEYFTPGSWELHLGWRGGDMLHDKRHFEAGRGNRIAWNKAVAGPTFPGTTQTLDGERPWAWRKDGAIDVILPMYGDAAGRPRVPFPYDGTDTGSISLYRNGALVRTEPTPDTARFDIPDEPATYRLVAETNRAAEWWPLSTKVSATWSFRSSTEDEAKALPLLTTRFDPAVDLRNRAPAGPFTFPMYVERQGDDRVKLTSLTVDVSYDDGGSWQPATVTPAGNHWTVGVASPATGYASIRAKATDTDGNTVEQTVLRAYQIGG
ncbi:hypothetical protein [Micromonospora sp. WMMD812]|uniref:hypothetical protein n=1 Tax=Micromonospora sp. WMMD812 TaxID=3015152 RepID=UPI00248B5C7E|nr:hypothetical protein [Micromonospora sp. WMMD812]WBB67656.1 hypothetical protein O7603_32040 [Micromonospora sp. WMMD812]